MRAAAAMAVALLGVAACTDLAPPSELPRPTILAVRADPPVIPAGARSQLSLLIAGPDGDVEPQSLTWRAIDPVTEQAGLGIIEVDSDGVAWYAAPERVPELTADVVEVTAEIDGSSPLVAIKLIGIGSPIATANPTLAGLRIDGQEVLGEENSEPGELEPFAVATSATISLDMIASPEPGEQAAYGWYSTAGEIELYRRKPTELVAPAEPGSARLYAVYRDGVGGITWRIVDLTFE